MTIWQIFKKKQKTLKKIKKYLKEVVSSDNNDEKTSNTVQFSKKEGERGHESFILGIFNFGERQYSFAISLLFTGKAET